MSALPQHVPAWPRPSAHIFLDDPVNDNEPSIFRTPLERILAFLACSIVMAVFAASIWQGFAWEAAQ